MVPMSEVPISVVLLFLMTLYAEIKNFNLQLKKTKIFGNGNIPAHMGTYLAGGLREDCGTRYIENVSK